MTERVRSSWLRQSHSGKRGNSTEEPQAHILGHSDLGIFPSLSGMTENSTVRCFRLSQNSIIYLRGKSQLSSSQGTQPVRTYDISQLTRTMPLRVHQSHKGFEKVASVSHHDSHRMQSLTKRASTNFRRPSSNTLAHQLTRTCPHQSGYVLLSECRSSSSTRV